MVCLAWLVLGTIARYCYARELRVRLQPTGGVPVSERGRPDGLRVLLLGDSRMAFWPDLPTNQFLTINAGVAGETTSQILLRLPAVLSNSHPGVVILQAGINDLKALGVFPEQGSAIQSRCLENLSEMVRASRQSGAKVVLVLVIQPGGIGWTRRLVWSDQIPEAVRQVNLALRQKFEHFEGVKVLDPALLLGVGRVEEDYRDELHLTPTAYKKLEAGLLPMLPP